MYAQSSTRCLLLRRRTRKNFSCQRIYKIFQANENIFTGTDFGLKPIKRRQLKIIIIVSCDPSNKCSNEQIRSSSKISIKKFLQSELEHELSEKMIFEQIFHSSALEAVRLVTPSVDFSCSAPDLSEDPVGSSSSSE